MRRWLTPMRWTQGGPRQAVAQIGGTYNVVKASGKGKGVALKLQCGTMGIQTFKRADGKDSAHVKAYPYKDLAHWTVGSTMSKGKKVQMVRSRCIFFSLESEWS